MNIHSYYNIVNFPRLVWARKNTNWHIYADAKGNCAAIPVVNGCLASDFGNLAHVAKCKQRDAINRGASDNRYANRVAKWRAMGWEG